MTTNLTQNNLASGLACEIYDVIAKYEDSILTATVVGVLEMLKVELIQNHFDQTKEEMQK